MTTSQESILPVPQTSTSVSLPPLLKTYQFWTVVLFLISLTFHLFFHFVLHAHGHLGYPFSLNSHDRFYDFTIFTEKFSYFHTEKFFQVGFPINYPAPVALFLEFFFKYTAPHALLAFVIVTILAFLIPAALFAHSLVKRNIDAFQAWAFVAILCLLSWPMLLIVDGANAEVAVWISLVVAMWAYATGRTWLAAIFFGIAASMKLFPFVFLGLFLSRRLIGRLFAGIASFLVVSVVSLKVLGPTIPIAFHGINFGLTSFKRNYMAAWLTAENGVDHSVFALFKAAMVLLFHHPTGDFTGWLTVYLFATCIGGILLFFLRIRHMPYLNQVLTLSVVSIYFTAFSGDGTLVHLYYPLAMLFFLAVQAHRDGRIVPGLSTILYCMVFCTSVDSFLVIAHKAQGARFIGPAHGIALGILLITSLRYNLGPPLSQGLSETVLSEPVTNWL